MKISKTDGFKSRDVIMVWHRERRGQQGVRQIHPVFIECIESMVLAKGL